MRMSTTSQGRRETLPGMLDTDLITNCPMAPGGAMPLRDWLKHLLGVDMWPVVVPGSTPRAADPEIAEPERDATNKRCPLLPDHWPHTGRGVPLAVERMSFAGLGAEVTSET